VRRARDPGDEEAGGAIAGGIAGAAVGAVVGGPVGAVVGGAIGAVGGAGGLADEKRRHREGVIVEREERR
jgi:non-heme chloroperoxidase